MIKTTIIWHDARTDKPDKSGEYFVYFVDPQVIMQIHYSAVHRLWNACDDCAREWAEETAVHGVTYWAELPELPEGGKEKRR